MTDAVLLSVAPVAANATHNDPREIARDVLACARAGAGMVHLHVRDPHGRLTPDTGHFVETLALIRAESDIVIEASTGGVSGLNISQLRIGFEDSAIIDQHQPPATSNEPIVAHMVAMLKAMGKRPMTPAEARTMLNIGARPAHRHSNRSRCAVDRDHWGTSSGTGPEIRQLWRAGLFCRRPATVARS